MYVATGCIPTEKTRGLTEPFIRHGRSNTFRNWDSSQKA